MKRIAALAVALVALAGPASAQNAGSSADRRFEAVYTVNARGVDAGEFTYNFTQTGATYQVAANRRTTGGVRLLVGDDQDYAYSVRGAVVGGALRPSQYRHQGGRRDRVVESRFTADDITTTATPHMGMGDPAATTAQKRGAVDQLTAIAAMVTATGDPCARTIPVYMDGRSRFDFVMRANGNVTVDTPAYRGQAIRCSVQYRPIAGFSDPQEPSTLTFLFARTASGLYAPIQIEMPTADGIVRLDARRLTVNGTRLR